MKIRDKKNIFFITTFLFLIVFGFIIKISIERKNSIHPIVLYDQNLSLDELDANSSIGEILEKNNKEIQSLEDADNQKELSLLLSKNSTFIILGTDERATETSRSDIIMLIKFIPKNQKVLIISIPRDTRVEIPGIKTDKINHAYAFGGAHLTKQTLEQLFDTEIDYYFKLNFENFKQIIDRIGGIQINAQKDFGYKGSVIIPKGEDLVNGEQALFYVRFRSDEEGDIGRIKRQQEVIQSLSKAIHNIGKEKAMPLLLEAYAENIETDIESKEMLGYYRVMDTMDKLELNVNTIKTTPLYLDNIWYEVYDPDDLARLKELLNN